MDWRRQLGRFRLRIETRRDGRYGLGFSYRHESLGFTRGEPGRDMRAEGVWLLGRRTLIVVLRWKRRD